MSKDLIDLARQKKAAAEQRLQELRDEMEQAAQEVSRWDTFIGEAVALASSVSHSRPKKGTETDVADGRKAKVTVQRDALAGWVAKLLSEQGPMSLKDIATALQAAGKGKEARDFATFASTINSALWRRKDLFEKKDGLYRLVREDFELVD